MIAALPLIALLVALLLGVPIAIALASAGMLGLWLVTGDLDRVIGMVSLEPFTTVSDYALTTIPMFILMAYFSSSSGLAKDLYQAAANSLSHVRGGLAMATVFACGIFGAMSGASVAAASVMSKIAMPEMRRHGYSDELAAGSIGVGSTLDILIPPSIGMVIYGVATGTSIGQLLIAGIVPGIIVGILLIIMIAIWVRVAPSHAPETFRVPAAERRAALIRVWPSMMLIALVIGMLYSGVATPSEIGALGALFAALIGARFGHLRWREAIDSIKETIRTSAMIFLILIGAVIFGKYMTLSHIPQDLVAYVTELNLNRWVVISLIIVTYFVVSMFMDEIPLLLLTLQLTFPLITTLGFDPVWFGVMSMMMVSMGLVFPPVGMVAFVVSATGNVELMKVYTGTSILMLAILMTTILLMIFPEIVLWLPRTMR